MFVHWDLRTCLAELRDNGRLNILMALGLRANQRLRAWPTMMTMRKDTGYASQAMNEGKKWLIEVGAIVLVPYEHREGEEKELGPRQHVYQLTGYIHVTGKTFQYLRFATPEAQLSVRYNLMEIIKHHAANANPNFSGKNSIFKILDSEISENERRSLNHIKKLIANSQDESSNPSSSSSLRSSSGRDAPTGPSAHISVLDELDHEDQFDEDDEGAPPSDDDLDEFLNSPEKENTWNNFVTLLAQTAGYDHRALEIKRTLGKVQTFASDLWNAGYTVHHLETFAYYAENDWRWGQRNPVEYPALSEIVDNIGRMNVTITSREESLSNLERLEKEYAHLLGD